MGRADAVQFLYDCAAAWRQLGARVTFEPGWENRGNGAAANYEGAIVHHTASPSSEARPFPTRSVLISGRPDLAGPLCNVAGPWCADGDPWLHVIAAHPANHAGASGGRSMGPLPVTSSFNARVLGLEIDYAGSSAMSAGQYRAALIFAKGVTAVLGRSIEFVRAHAETSVTGKWDPGYAPGKTIDMAAFRRDAAVYEGDDMPLSDDDVDRIAHRVHEIEWTRQDDPARTVNLKEYLRWYDGGRAKDRAELAALREAVTQSAAKPGAPIDLQAVYDAAHRAAADALAQGVNVDVTVGGQPQTA